MYHQIRTAAAETKPIFTHGLPERRRVCGRLHRWRPALPPHQRQRRLRPLRVHPLLRLEHPGKDPAGGPAIAPVHGLPRRAALQRQPPASLPHAGESRRSCGRSSTSPAPIPAMSPLWKRSTICAPSVTATQRIGSPLPTACGNAPTAVPPARRWLRGSNPKFTIYSLLFLTKNSILPLVTRTGGLMGHVPWASGFCFPNSQKSEARLCLH